MNIYFIYSSSKSVVCCWCYNLGIFFLCFRICWGAPGLLTAVRLLQDLLTGEKHTYKHTHRQLYVYVWLHKSEQWIIFPSPDPRSLLCWGLRFDLWSLRNLHQLSYNVIKEKHKTLNQTLDLLHCRTTGITYIVDLICFFRFVYIWDTTSRRILYKLPGHAGSVNEVTFHPEEPVGESNSCLNSKVLKRIVFIYVFFKCM